MVDLQNRRCFAGHLATIRSPAENTWLAATFGTAVECLWIGLNDAQSEGTFAWSSGEPVSYTNWNLNEPNGGTIENWVHMSLPWGGLMDLTDWNDAPNTPWPFGWPAHGIMEVSPTGPVGWVFVSSTGPGPRARHALSYDSQAGNTVLFGGDSSSAYPLGDTWVRNVTGWTQVANSGPPPRRFHAMAYDSQRAKTVLFGGYSLAAQGGGLGTAGDTWEWNGSIWTQATQPGPSARTSHAMAYDIQRGRVVLFGGYVPFLDITLGDTWEWDGVVWTQVSNTGPAPRLDHAMAYDSQRGRTVMFGGVDGASSIRGDTWEWDGQAWSLVASNGPAPRLDHAMAYDNQRGMTVLFGGRYGSASFLGDTWVWEGATWTQVAAVGPTARSDLGLAYDDQLRRMVLHGGRDTIGDLSDTWELVSVVGATVHTFGAGCGSPSVTMAPRPGSRPVLGQTQISDISNVPFGIAVVAVGLSNEYWQGIPLPLSLDAIGVNGCLLLQSAEELASGCNATGPTTASHNLAIPVDYQLIGLHVYLQAWTFAPGYNPMGLATGNAIDLGIGDV